MTRYYLDIILAILMGIFGLGYAIAGCQGIIRRRPLFNVRQGLSLLNYLFLFVFWTIFLASFGIQFLEIDNENISIGSVVIVFLISALLAFLAGLLPRLLRAKSTAGASIYGINKNVLNLLRQAMAKEGIAYREMHEDFTLTDLSAVIYTTLWSDVGYAALKIDPKEKLPILEKIIQTMKAYDKDHSDYFSIKFMILQILCGLFLAGVGIVLAYLFLKLIIV